jgi:hypothetical protein
MVFFKKWVARQAPGKFFAYDVTSFPTYAKDIIDSEWAYNRDRDKLPQINLGYILSEDSSLPVFYVTYPGSIGVPKRCKTTLAAIDLAREGTVPLCSKVANLVYAVTLKGYFAERLLLWDTKRNKCLLFQKIWRDAKEMNCSTISNRRRRYSFWFKKIFQARCLELQKLFFNISEMRTALKYLTATTVRFSS